MLQLYWVETPSSIAGRAAITSRPLGRERLTASVAYWRESGLDVVISLLAEDEASALGLDRAGEACAAAGIELLRVPTTDFGVPPLDRATVDLLDRLAGRLGGGASIAAHCYAGRGRSPTFLAGVLVRAGLGADDAFERIGAARGRVVPETDEQCRWVERVEALAGARPGDPGR
jgi:protein-tyrosine phosphatase